MIDAQLNLWPDDEHNIRPRRQCPPSGVAEPDSGRAATTWWSSGAGTAGLVAAAGAAGMGARVALVERQLMGGDCLNVGCVPSKAIIRSAHAAHNAATAGRFGIKSRAKSTSISKQVMERMRGIRADISPADSARRFAEHYGVDVFFGKPRFSGSRDRRCRRHRPSDSRRR